MSSSRNFKRKSRERIANFPEFRRATRTEFVFLGQHALRKPYDVTEALDRVHRAFRSEKAAARRRDHVNFVRKSRGRIAKLPEIRRALRKKNCVYSAIVRCKNICLTSLQILFKSEACSDPKNCASGVEITQKLCKNLAKELQNFRKFQHADRRKKYVQSASVRCANLGTTLKLSMKSDVCSDPKNCASSVENTRNQRKNFTKELQIFRDFGAPRANREMPATDPSRKCSFRRSLPQLGTAGNLRF